MLQVALSLVLIVGAGLFVNTLRNLRNVSLGFNSDGLLLFSLDPSLNGYEADRTSALYRQVLDRLNNTPSVISATATSHRLLSGWMSNAPVQVPGSASLPDGRIPGHINAIAPRFFETMGIPLLLGHSPEEINAAAKRTAVVNKAMADKAFPGLSPLGRIIQLMGQDYEITGVSANALYADLKQEPPPTVYIPYEA